jgi:hypothetical protein
VHTGSTFRISGSLEPSSIQSYESATLSFTLASGELQGRSISGSIYTLNGRVYDPVEGSTVALEGNYNPDNKTWSASAMTDSAGYYFYGVFDSNGNSLNNSASITVAEPGETYTHWQEFSFPVTTGAFSGPGTSGSGEDGLPVDFRGLWTFTGNEKGKDLKYDVLISPFTLNLTRFIVGGSEDGKFELEGMTIIEVEPVAATSTYRVTYTKSDAGDPVDSGEELDSLAAAFEYFADVEVAVLSDPVEEGNLPEEEGPWVAFVKNNDGKTYGGFTPEQQTKIFNAYFSKEFDIWLEDNYELSPPKISFARIDLTLNGNALELREWRVWDKDTEGGKYTNSLDTLEAFETAWENTDKPPEKEESMRFSRG